MGVRGSIIVRDHIPVTNHVGLFYYHILKLVELGEAIISAAMASLNGKYETV
jgi:hypothetical protein